VPDRFAGAESLKQRGRRWDFEGRLIRHYHPEGDANWRRLRASYCGMLRLIDDQLGRFVAFLDDSGLRESTIFVFLSDHGDFVGEYGLIRKGPELPEVLCRIPLVITGPGIEALGWAKRWTLWTGVRIGGASAWASGPRRLQAWERRRTPRSAREGDPPQDPSPCF